MCTPTNLKDCSLQLVPIRSILTESIVRSKFVKSTLSVCFLKSIYFVLDRFSVSLLALNHSETF